MEVRRSIEKHIEVRRSELEVSKSTFRFKCRKTPQGGCGCGEWEHTLKFANWGAMRMAPLALAFRQTPEEQLHEAVRMAIISSHAHPEGVDGAFVLAEATILALQYDSVDDFDPL